MYEHNIVLADCDGVALHWESAYCHWMKTHGYPVLDDSYPIDSHGFCIEKMYGIPLDEVYFTIRIFNESAQIEHLPPLRDAVKYVRKMHEEHGVVFHFLTSFSDDFSSIELRKRNLVRLFGESAVGRIKSIAPRQSKRDMLEEYRDSGLAFVEDRMDNVDLGIEMGLDGYLLAHRYNVGYSGEATRVQNWSDLYERLFGLRAGLR